MAIGVVPAGAGADFRVTVIQWDMLRRRIAVMLAISIMIIVTHPAKVATPIINNHVSANVIRHWRESFGNLMTIPGSGQVRRLLEPKRTAANIGMGPYGCFDNK
jgi:hypothetical protein